MAYDPTKQQPVENLGRVLTDPTQPVSLFREACERIADMLKQDDGEAFFEAEKFLKRHAPDFYNSIGESKDGTCDLQMEPLRPVLGNAELDAGASNSFDASKRGFNPK